MNTTRQQRTFETWLIDSEISDRSRWEVIVDKRRGVLGVKTDVGELRFHKKRRRASKEREEAMWNVISRVVYGRHVVDMLCKERNGLRSAGRKQRQQIEMLRGLSETPPKASDEMVRVALDAITESWPTITLNQYSRSQVADMRAALNAALKVAQRGDEA